MFGGCTQGDVQAGFNGHCSAGYSDVDQVMLQLTRLSWLCDMQSMVLQRLLTITLC